MSSLAAEFASQMRKQVVDAHGESTPSSEGPSDKCSRLSSLEEEAQKSPTVIVVDSPEQVPDDMLALESLAQGALQEACATLEDLIMPIKLWWRLLRRWLLTRRSWLDLLWLACVGRGCLIGLC